MNQPTILITRPEPECSRLAAMLQRSGVESISMPAIRFRGLPVSADVAGLEQAGPGPSVLVFTSPRAVEFGLPRLPERILKQSEMAAIGPATASALEEAGYRVAVRGEAGFTSEDLLSIEFWNDTPGTAVLVTAPEGRPVIRDTLVGRGWKVRQVDVYQRAPTILDEDTVNRVRETGSLWTLWTSMDAMRFLYGRLPRDAWERIRAGRWLVISERLKRAATGMGVSQVAVLSSAANRQVAQEIGSLLAPADGPV